MVLESGRRLLQKKTFVVCWALGVVSSNVVITKSPGGLLTVWRRLNDGDGLVRRAKRALLLHRNSKNFDFGAGWLDGLILVS